MKIPVTQKVMPMSGKARLTEVLEALHEARGADAQLAAIAAYEHAKATKGERIAPERIPTCASMVEWLPDCPEHAWRDMWHRKPESDSQDGCRIRSGQTWLCAIGLSASANWRWRVGKGPWHGDPREGVPRIHWDVTVDSLAEAIQTVHSSWLALPAARRGAHPLGPIIRAWQDLPVSISKPDTRDRRIMPGGLFPDSPLHVVSDAKQRELRFPGAAEEVPVQFPLAFREEEQIAHVVRPAPLILADAAGFGGTLRGRGARWDKRLLIYSLLSMPLGQRRPGGRYTLRRSLRSVVHEMFPPGRNGRSNWQPGKHGKKLIAALEALSLVRVRMPKGTRYGAWAPALVRGYPDIFDLNSEVCIELALPDECDRGPMIRHPPLVRAGASSDPAFDLWMGLAFYWDSTKAANGGYRIYATRPTARRNAKGHLLNSHGHVILRKDGTPVKDWRHRRAVLEGEERHPQADRVPLLTSVQLRAMAYGQRAAAGGQRAKDQGRFIRKTLARWVARDLVVVEKHVRAVRILECWPEVKVVVDK